MKIANNINNLITIVIDILFPIKCVNCGAENEVLCDQCVQKIRPAERETERDIFAVFDYRDPAIKKAIWELKYHHKRYLAKRLGELLYESMIEEISELKKLQSSGKPIIIIPVPTSKGRTKVRGYNQSFEIAKEFSKRAERGTLEIFNDIVYRKIEVPPQARISNRKERLKNIRGVFDIKKDKLNKIKGRTVIIIDDVTTTGGTITEIMKILKKAKIKKAIGFAVAH